MPKVETNSDVVVEHLHCVARWTPFRISTRILGTVTGDYQFSIGQYQQAKCSNKQCTSILVGAVGSKAAQDGVVREAHQGEGAAGLDCMAAHSSWPKASNWICGTDFQSEQEKTPKPSYKASYTSLSSHLFFFVYFFSSFCALCPQLHFLVLLSLIQL